MVVYDYTTGCWNANLAVNVSRMNIEQPPILQNDTSELIGKKGEVFTLIETGIRVQLLEDIMDLASVKDLKAQNKLIYIGTFIGANE